MKNFKTSVIFRIHFFASLLESGNFHLFFFLIFKQFQGGVYLFRAFGLFSVVTCLLHALCQIVFANSRAARHSMPGNSGNGDRFNVVFNRSEKNDVADFVRVRNTSEVEAPILKGSCQHLMLTIPRLWLHRIVSEYAGYLISNIS